MLSQGGDVGADQVEDTTAETRARCALCASTHEAACIWMVSAHGMGHTFLFGFRLFGFRLLGLQALIGH